MTAWRVTYKTPEGYTGVDFFEGEDFAQPEMGYTLGSLYVYKIVSGGLVPVKFYAPGWWISYERFNKEEPK